MQKKEIEEVVTFFFRFPANNLDDIISSVSVVSVPDHAASAAYEVAGAGNTSTTSISEPFQMVLGGVSTSPEPMQTDHDGVSDFDIGHDNRDEHPPPADMSPRLHSPPALPNCDSPSASSTPSARLYCNRQLLSPSSWQQSTSQLPQSVVFSPSRSTQPYCAATPHDPAQPSPRIADLTWSGCVMEILSAPDVKNCYFEKVNQITDCWFMKRNVGVDGRTVQQRDTHLLLRVLQLRYLVIHDVLAASTQVLPVVTCSCADAVPFMRNVRRLEDLSRQNQLDSIDEVRENLRLEKICVHALIAMQWINEGSKPDGRVACECGSSHAVFDSFVPRPLVALDENGKEVNRPDETQPIVLDLEKFSGRVQVYLFAPPNGPPSVLTVGGNKKAACFSGECRKENAGAHGCFHMDIFKDVYGFSAGTLGSCDDVELFRIGDGDGDGVDEYSSERETRTKNLCKYPQCVTKSPISYPLLENPRANFIFQAHLVIGVTPAGDLVFKPTHCDSCKTELTEWGLQFEATLASMTGECIVQSRTGHCATCHAVVPYTGEQESLFVVHPKLMLSLEILVRCESNLVNLRTSIFGFYCALVDSARAMGGEFQTLTYFLLTCAFWGFLKCRRRALCNGHASGKPQLPFCPICGPEPKHICGDGTGLGQQIKYVMDWFQQLQNDCGQHKLVLTAGGVGTGRGIFFPPDVRKAIAAFLKKVPARAAMISESVALPNTGNADFDNLLALFVCGNLPSGELDLPPGANDKALRHVLVFVKSLSGVSYVDSFFMGGTVEEVKIHCLELQLALQQLPISIVSYSSTMSSFMQHNSYLANLIDVIFSAHWLPSRLEILQSLLQFIAQLANVVAGPERTTPPASNLCSLCSDDTEAQFMLAVRPLGDKSMPPDFLQWAAQCLSTLKDTIREPLLTEEKGYIALHGYFLTRKIARKFVEATLFPPGSPWGRDFEVEIVFDSNCNAGFEGLPPNCFGSGHVFRRPCAFPATGAGGSEGKEGKSSCGSHSNGNGSGNNLTPGIFAVFCLHGVIVEVFSMICGETPRFFFESMRRRFVFAPDVVYYDLACAEHKYSLLRTPHFFRKTRFVLDRFHVPNHDGCSAGYHPKSHPDLKMDNTQIAEQSNSFFDPLKGHLQYTNQEHFDLALGVFSARYSEKVVARWLAWMEKGRKRTAAQHVSGAVGL